MIFHVIKRYASGSGGFEGGIVWGSVVKKEFFFKNPLAYMLYCIVMLFKPYGSTGYST